jgi:hypothetical protein
MLGIGLSDIAFIMLKYIPSIPSFLRAFIMKWFILSKSFSASTEMLQCFLSLLLLMCCTTFIYLDMLMITGMMQTWS